jgi:hypothetical protein
MALVMHIILRTASGYLKHVKRLALLLRYDFAKLWYLPPDLSSNRPSSFIAISYVSAAYAYF